VSNRFLTVWSQGPTSLTGSLRSANGALPLYHDIKHTSTFVYLSVVGCMETLCNNLSVLSRGIQTKRERGRSGIRNHLCFVKVPLPSSSTCCVGSRSDLPPPAENKPCPDKSLPQTANLHTVAADWRGADR